MRFGCSAWRTATSCAPSKRPKKSGFPPGRYRFRVVNAFGMQDLHVLCVANEVFDFVRSQVRTLGHGDSSGMPPSDAKVRSVVKSLVNNAPWFDGEVASLTTGEPSRGLNQFGC
jgi:hypothetical protein